MNHKKTIIRGAFLLTVTGLISKVFGFYYRIFLTKEIGAEGMGIYHLIFPVYVMCFSLCAAGIETTLSRLIAAQNGNLQNARRILRTGLFCSLLLTIPVLFSCQRHASFIACDLLKDDRCASLVRILSYSIPPSCIHACISGYYYGLKKTGVPSVSQLIEQLSRIGGVYLLYKIAPFQTQIEKIELAVWGLAIGECASALLSLTAFLGAGKGKKTIDCQTRLLTNGTILYQLSAQAVPLTMNRVFTNLLQSFESVLIPLMLQKSGLPKAGALSVYGILMGMAMPLILFPSALTNSLSVMLLSETAESSANQEERRLARTIETTMEFSVFLGIFCAGYFLALGNLIGIVLFNEEVAGNYICLLAFICPFLYLSSTLGSILHGCGKTLRFFFFNTGCLLLRIAVIVIFTPKYGILACFCGMLAAQILLTVLIVQSLKKVAPLKTDLARWIGGPCLYLLFSFSLIKGSETLLLYFNITHPALQLALKSVLFILPFSVKMAFNAYQNHQNRAGIVSSC